MEFSQFFTPLNELQYQKKIQINDSILAIGSCFSNNIGAKLNDSGFNIIINPFETVFNPISLFKHIENSITNTIPDETLFVEHNGLWYHFDWHSNIFGKNREELISKINKIQRDFKDYLIQTDFLILTFGTAIVRKKDGRIVNNCHKQPNSQFTKAFIEDKALHRAFNQTLELIRSLNPKLKLITTTSPVRHTKEGLIQNSTSKSILNAFNHKISSSYPNIDYFPSYEIVIDVLRDYRFYEADLIHPNTQAVDYIWGIFKNSIIDPNGFEYIKKRDKLNKMNGHKINYSDSIAAHKFEEKKRQLSLELESIKQNFKS